MQEDLARLHKLLLQPPVSSLDFFRLGNFFANLGLNNTELQIVEQLVSAQEWNNIAEFLKSKFAEKQETNKEEKKEEKQEENKEQIPQQIPTNIPVPIPQASFSPEDSKKREVFVPIESFAWDQGDYNGSTVTIFVTLENVGSVKNQVNCNFTKSSFDLKVLGLNGNNYRLFKDNLDKDIIPDQSSFSVKKNKVVVKLQKQKGEYSYDTWTDLTAKKPKQQSKAANDPMGGLMDMMKDMYDKGDDNMKKTIAEAMMKAQRGDKVESSMPEF
jgi:calcyclin binding protein